MKTKFFTLFAVFMLLFGAKAMAQTDGDVNGDGKVDEQDITAIIQIMQEAGGVKEQTKYYWYVGTENPLTMDEMSPIVGKDASNGVGFRVLDMSKTYSITNKLYDFDNAIYGEKSAIWYAMLPQESSLKFYDDLGESPLEMIGTKGFGDGIVYNVYKHEASRPVGFFSMPYIY